jgi:hypothetical protein
MSARWNLEFIRVNLRLGKINTGGHPNELQGKNSAPLSTFKRKGQAGAIAATSSDVLTKLVARRALDNLRVRPSPYVFHLDARVLVVPGACGVPLIRVAVLGVAPGIERLAFPDPPRHSVVHVAPAIKHATVVLSLNWYSHNRCGRKAKARVNRGAVHHFAAHYCACRCR